ncbi:hypothetical protein ABZ357_39220, partial [Streptomyces sp. NPDC005917]|uniref:hypothetical protein n=1 Tax=unclassified Streptomyces TaxID=2593676 RepID=UPI00340349DF
RRSGYPCPATRERAFTPALKDRAPCPERPVVNRRRVVDGRHALDPAQWRAAGWEYRALGRN